MTRDEPGPDPADPADPSIPAAPADVPEGTAPPVRSEGGTSETLPPVEGIRLPEPGDPE
jgi:hypothetical protein